MINKSRHYLIISYLILDAVIISCSYFLSWYLVFGRPNGLGGLPKEQYFKVIPILIPVYLILFKIFHLYDAKRRMGSFAIMRSITYANIVGILIFTFVLYLFRKNANLIHFSSRMLAIFFVLDVLLVGFERIVFRKIRKNGHYQKHIVLVGYSDACKNLIDAFKRNPEWGYNINAILDDLSPVGETYRGYSVKGEIDSLADILQNEDIDEVAITLPLAAYNKLETIVNTCEKYGVHTKFVPEYFNIIHSKPVTEDMDGVPVVNIRAVPLTDPVNAFVKRLMDIIFSLFFIILFSPVMIVTAIAVRLSSPGPILFRQERVGLHNKIFNMYKFRSMVQQRPEDEKKGWTTKGDARVTKVGKFIRSTSIDELPQFFNVLFGSMSIVGPRPERDQFVKQFMEEIPRYNVKHQVRPGITGWAQVNGLRGDTSIPERIKYDLFYIENWSATFDIKIMFLTVFKGFINKNAY